MIDIQLWTWQLSPVDHKQFEVADMIMWLQTLAFKSYLQSCLLLEIIKHWKQFKVVLKTFETKLLNLLKFRRREHAATYLMCSAPPASPNFKFLCLFVGESLSTATQLFTIFTTTMIVLVFATVV